MNNHMDGVIYCTSNYIYDMTADGFLIHKYIIDCLSYGLSVTLRFTS